MKKLLLILLTIPLISFAEAINEDDLIYLNACTGNAKEYFSAPLNLGNLNEVGNKITSLERSPYDREFTTLATSSVSINGKTIDASLENFRNLTLTDNDGNVLLNYKISGTSSLYEIRRKDKVVAWGVGWHNYCKEYYSHTTFTVFRIFTPVVENNEVIIDNFAIRGAYPSIEESSDLMKYFLKNNKDLLVETKEITSPSKPANCYYCLPIFYEFNNGFHKIISSKKLAEYLDLDQYKKYNPLQYLAFLSYNELVDELNKFISLSYDEISNAIESEWLKNVRNHKAECLAKIENNKSIKSLELGVHCFPNLAHHGYFGYSNFDYDGHEIYEETGNNSEMIKKVTLRNK